MALHTPLWVQPSGGDPDITPTAQEFRRLLSGLMQVCSINSQGVFSAADCLVVQRGAGANFSVDIPAGFIMVVGDDVTGQGLYFNWNDATVNVATPTAPGSGTRFHRVICQVRDKLHNGAFTTYDCQFQVLADPGTGLPAEPNSACTLAQVAIAAGQLSVLNANITDLRPFVANAPWQSMTLQAGWTNNAPHAKYRLAPFNKLEVVGDISAGTITDATQIAAALPSVGGYRPAVSQSIKLIAVGNSGTTVDGPRLNINAGTGTLSIFGLPAGTTSIRFNESISLDVT